MHSLSLSHILCACAVQLTKLSLSVHAFYLQFSRGLFWNVRAVSLNAAVLYHPLYTCSRLSIRAQSSDIRVLSSNIRAFVLSVRAKSPDIRVLSSNIRALSWFGSAALSLSRGLSCSCRLETELLMVVCSIPDESLMLQMFHMQFLQYHAQYHTLLQGNTVDLHT